MNDLAYTVHLMNDSKKDDAITLELLEAIEGKCDVSQRHLADRLGVALGLANSYLKRCVRKGLIKMHQAPSNRYLYYLTPKGFAEKSRLTAEYLRTSFDFYRYASASLQRVFDECLQRGARHILFCGASELAEIASLRAAEKELLVVGVFENKMQPKIDSFVGLPVSTSTNILKECDACVITSMEHPEVLLALIKQYVPKDRIYIPDILGIKL